MFNNKEYDKRYYLKNKERIRKLQKEYWKKYSRTDKRRQSWFKYSLTPKHYYHILRSNSRRYGRSFSLTMDEFLVWYEHTKKICYYCGIPQEKLEEKNLFSRPFKNKLSKQRLAIDRKDNNNGYAIDNIVLACPRCNVIKSNFFTETEMRKIAQKYITPKWKK